MPISHSSTPDMPTNMAPSEKLLTPRAAAHMPGISYSTLKQWIYKSKIRTIHTVGHHRIPVTEVDRFLYRATGNHEVTERRAGFRRVSGERGARSRGERGVRSFFKAGIGAAVLTAVISLAGAVSCRAKSVRGSDERRRAAIDLTVSAAISLQNTLQDIARLYHAQNQQVTVHLNLGASGTLQRQIEEGAPVDLFLSAAPAEMDALERKNLIIRETRKDLVANSLVLITPKGRREVSNFQALAQPFIKVIAIGNPQSVPAGKYAQEVLTHFGLYDRLEPKFVFAKDVRQVLTYVETGNVDAGIVYKTDALTTNLVTVDATAPPGSHSPVIYPVAVIAGSHDVSAAKAFESFLLGSQSAHVFRSYGFNPVAQ